MTTLDMVRIVNAGGGLRVNCKGKNILDLIRIANATQQNNGFLILTNINVLNTLDMMRIANAGKGHVFFDDIL